MAEISSLLFVSSDRLVQNRTDLSVWCSHKTASFCTEQCKNKSHKALKNTHSRTVWDAIFKFCMMWDLKTALQFSPSLIKFC